jgi:hypothetical protein
VVVDVQSCSAQQAIVTTAEVIKHCDPAIGARCALDSHGSAFCQGSPPPARPGRRRQAGTGAAGGASEALDAALQTDSSRFS